MYICVGRLTVLTYLASYNYRLMHRKFRDALL